MDQDRATLFDAADCEIHEDQVIGKGDTGILCRGRLRTAGRDVLVKLLRDDIAATPERSERLRREAESLDRVREPSVVQVLGTGVWKGKLFYAMEPLEGQSLAGFLREGHRFTSEEIVHVAEGVGKALKAAWSHKILHGAIKPSNILLDRSGAVKVLNFGMARALVPPADATLPAHVWRYLSPEHAAGGAAIDVRSDLYSLGVVLYELASGKTPFDGYDSTTSLIYQLLYVQPPSPREAGSSISRDLERVILRCLAKSRDERYATPEEFLAELDAVRASSRTSLPRPDAPETDTGDYEIFEDQVIGEGGMGTLYRGRQHSLGRPVAVKVIRGVFTANPEFVQRFRREAELLAQLNDPTVVQVFGTGTWKGRLFYAMELVEGQDLASRLQGGHVFSVEEILRVAEGVGKALRAAWKYKIVHRDIKPSNILLTPDGRVKVADFGLAKSLRLPRTDSHLIAGTSEYLAPEQGIGQPVDVRSDLYSLGVVLYEIAAGKPPFRWEGSFTTVIYQHVHSEPPPIPRGGRIPEDVHRLIERCLAKKPEDRFPTPDAFLDEVRAIRARLEPGTSPTPGTSEAKSLTPASPVPRPEPPGETVAKGRASLRRASAALLIAAGVYLGVAVGGRVRAAPAPPDVPASFRPSYELALGLGDYATAMSLAERHRGRGSREFREAERRRRDARCVDTEREIRGLLEAGEWDRAARLCQGLLSEADGDRRDALARAAEFCRDLARAADLERRGKPREALEIYRQHADAEGPSRVHIQNRIQALSRTP